MHVLDPMKLLRRRKERKWGGNLWLEIFIEKFTALGHENFHNLENKNEILKTHTHTVLLSHTESKYNGKCLNYSTEFELLCYIKFFLNLSETNRVE
jgi:hypothetical protein